MRSLMFELFLCVVIGLPLAFALMFVLELMLSLAFWAMAEVLWRSMTRGLRVSMMSVARATGGRARC